MNMPTLRFPLQDNKWREEPVISLADYVDYRGKTPKKTESGVFLVTAKNIKQGYIDYESSQEFIDPGEYDEVMRRGKPKIDDVLITTEAPLGNIASVDREDIALAQRVIKYRGKDKILNSCFLKQLFLAPRFQDEIASKATGGTVQGIKGSVLHQIKIYIPDLDEQTMIADFLSSVDEKITLLNKQYDLLCQYKKGMMQKVFSQELRFKDDNGGNFPEWETCKLKKFLIPTLREVKKPIENFLSIGIRSHFKGTFHKDNQDPNKVSVDKLFLVHEGDFILNITFAWEGALAIAKKEDDLGYVSHRFPTYTFNKEFIISEFFRYIYTLPKFLTYLDLCSPGGAGRNRVLKKSEFLEIEIDRPCLAEQTKIANLLSALDDKIAIKKAELDRLKTWKQGLLQQMFV
ncbi:restriction endonuclease subunit S [Pectobacterium betavasculorum]|uniref:restriction endonuclease subunit S n=1 Tax=Pectobacterium betavasculorum TaxID=55207 RepID=UPI00068DAA1C|nr:restriction endonuclease subunit S [Pectobacterium betavasculorum]